ncbi:class I SAM-dependent methyltransferase [Nocardioides sp.]|uniref:class I SAM-dependent methyltransferase n=1 Tax=Nocardioides sp. TaxID=35761 RepID=UPI002B26EBB8|nr:methyltransferase domain-containing protein [Nocardioides sp.]
MSDDRHDQARSFGSVADAYDRGRPTYPADAVSWLATGEVPDDAPGSPAGSQVTVLELGAGTGKLTRTLVAQGHDVHASEPDQAMLEILRRDLPGVPTSLTGAESIPLGDASVDVVIAAQCFHWFDAEAALDEISRVLKPGGHLSLVWHWRDERIPWVKKLGRIIGTQDHVADPASALAESDLFGEVEEQTFKHWQVVNRRSIVDLVQSRSNVAMMSETERSATIESLLALYDDYGRGMDGMQLPYLTRCFRSRALPRRAPAPAPAATSAATHAGDDQPRASTDPALDLPALALDPLVQPTVPLSVSDLVRAGLSRRPGVDPLADSADRMPRVAFSDHSGPSDDTGMLLIDFR